jgi:hypothetical protein
MVSHHDIAEILLKVALNTIPGIVWTDSLYIQSIFNVCVEFKMLFITNILIDKDWTNIIQLLFGGLYLCDAFFLGEYKWQTEWICYVDIFVMQSCSERTTLHCIESYLYYIISVNKKIFSEEWNEGEKKIDNIYTLSKI